MAFTLGGTTTLAPHVHAITETRAVIGNSASIRYIFVFLI
jgi:hypothetical protein